MSKTSKTSKTTDLRAHYGMSATPFTRELPIRQCWRPSHFDEALGDLLDIVDKRMAAALISPPGSGKTTLLRCVQDRLPEARYRVHYVKVTALSMRDFCRELCEAIGAVPAASYNGLVRRIQERLTTLLDQDSLRPVLIVDEAHDMRPDVLAILRVLTNFEMDSRLVVSVILSGQGPLKTMLARQELESVRRRLSHVTTLRLLSREETTAYVAHRLSVAGVKDDVFDSAAHDAIYEMTNGNLRAIDRVALKALELACRDGKTTVGSDYLSAAARKLLL